MNLRAIGMIETNILRLIFNKRSYEISNKNFYEKVNLLHQLFNNTKRFFEHQKLCCSLTENLGNETREFTDRMKYKQVHHRLLEAETDD